MFIWALYFTFISQRLLFAEIQVRHAQIQNGGRVETALLGSHQGRAHKLAIEPGSPYIFYTCGEDGLVQHVSFDCAFCFYIMFHQHSTYYCNWIS